MITNDWRKGIEDTDCFISIISPNFFEEPLCIDQALYAKSLNKPTILIIVKGTVFTIPDLFDNIVLKIEIKDAIDLRERKQEINNKIKEALKKRKLSSAWHAARCRIG